jgi:hypothetical protein
LESFFRLCENSSLHMCSTTAVLANTRVLINMQVTLVIPSGWTNCDRGSTQTAVADTFGAGTKDAPLM